MERNSLGSRPYGGDARMSPSLLEKALAGKDLDFEEGLTLATVEGNDLLALVKVADETAPARGRRQNHLRGEQKFELHQRLHRGLCFLRIQSRRPMRRMLIFIPPIRCWPNRSRPSSAAPPRCAFKAASRKI